MKVLVGTKADAFPVTSVCERSLKPKKAALAKKTRLSELVHLFRSSGTLFSDSGRTRMLRASTFRIVHAHKARPTATTATTLFRRTLATGNGNTSATPGQTLAEAPAVDAPPQADKRYGYPSYSKQRFSSEGRSSKGALNITKTPQTTFGLYCQSTRSNTIVTITRTSTNPAAAPSASSSGPGPAAGPSTSAASSGVVAWFSGGSCQFKGANRASYEAGYQCAKQSFRALEGLLKAEPDARVELFFKGFGQGREAMRGALLAVEGETVRRHVKSVTDRTPIKIGGTRAKKAKRL